ncbi:MAG: tetratricopeptide repeat protein [Candidatus Rokuibacteriota bacterium]
MRRALPLLTAVASLALVVIFATPAPALDEAERLWLVGERAAADGLHALARRTLERFVDAHPKDKRVPAAVLLLGRAQLGAGDAQAALESFRRAQTFNPRPGQGTEVKFWEAEALFRLRRYAEARDAYDVVVKTDAASPLAPDALYGYGWTQQELRQPEAAVKAFGDLVQTWPEHPTVPSATFYRARGLTELKRFSDALPLLEAFRGRYPDHKLGPDAQYLLGWLRLQTGDPRGGLADLRAFVKGHASHPQAAEARRLMTETMARHGDRNEQQEVYRTLMAESPSRAEGLWEAAAIAAKLGRDSDQGAAWRKLRAQFPDHALGQRAALELAQGAYKRKEWKDVLEHARAAARSEDGAASAEGWLLTGEAELKLKHFAAAQKAFESAVAIKNVEPSLRFRALAGLGLSHEEQREWKQALAAYESVAGKSSDTTLRDWARERAKAVRARMAPVPDKKRKSGS